MTDGTGAVVWSADYKPFGEATITVSTITNNLRFPGQYYDAETGLNYNYFRDYNPAIGRYPAADPIGIRRGQNHLYVYAQDNPVTWVDPFGLDVTVCYYPEAAQGFGHVGFGLPGENTTSGFYPTGDPFKSPGKIHPDNQDEKYCKTTKSPPDKDECMRRCRNRRAKDPGMYKLKSRQCTDFVRDCLTECGLPAGNYSGPRPYMFFNDLPGKEE